MTILGYLKHLNRKRLFRYRRNNQLRQLKTVSERHGPIDMNQVQEVFFPLIAYVGLGDIVFLTGVFKAFKQLGKSVVVAVPPAKRFMFEGIHHVDKLVLIDPNQPMTPPAHPNTDLIIDLYSRFDEGTHLYYQLFSAMGCRYRIGFNVIDPQPYNLTFTVPFPHAHITDAYQQLFSSLGLPQQQLDYDVTVPVPYADEAHAFLNALKEGTPHSNIIVFNPYASSGKRSLIPQDVERLLALLASLADHKVVLIGEAHKMALLPNHHAHVAKAPFQHFWHAAALLAQSDLVISVDSAPVHLANAWRKPLVAMYSSETLNGLLGDTFYAPNYPQATQLIMPDAEHRDMNQVFDAVVHRLASST